MFCLISSERKVQSCQIWSHLKAIIVLGQVKLFQVTWKVNWILYKAKSAKIEMEPLLLLLLDRKARLEIDEQG